MLHPVHIPGRTSRRTGAAAERLGGSCSAGERRRGMSPGSEAVACLVDGVQQVLASNMTNTTSWVEIKRCKLVGFPFENKGWYTRTFWGLKENKLSYLSNINLKTSCVCPSHCVYQMTRVRIETWIVTFISRLLKRCRNPNGMQSRQSRVQGIQRT